MWQAHSHKSNTRVINPALLDELTREWTSIEDAVQDLLKTISSNPSFSYVQHPKEACVRAAVALNRLRNDFGAWRDFVEVFRNLQRNLLELRAFLSWWKDACASDDFQSSIRAPTRGSIFYDKDLFANHARWSVAAFLLIHKSLFTPDPAKKVTLSPRTLWNAQPMLPHPPVTLFSIDIVMDLETAARGYAERLDTFNPTMAFKRTLDKIENKQNDEAGRKAKVAKVTQSHLELRHLTDAAPDWFTKPHEIWLDAMNYVKDLDFAPTVSHRRFALPPVHLFWGGSEQNQRTYYYHFFLLHQEIISRRATERRFPGLTTQEWRSVLGNTYWKQQWPKHDGNVSPHDSTFDPDAFWRHGGPLLFGDELSAEIAAGRFDPTSTLPCRCAVRMDTADDPDIRQAVLYQLGRQHLFEEIREMERLQFPDNPGNRWLFKFPNISNVTALFGPSYLDYVDPHFRLNERWIGWAQRLRDAVMDWDGFDRWDWDGLPDVEDLKSLNGLWIWRSWDQFRKFIIRLLAFLIHSFVTRLGYYPSPLRYPPTLNTHSCDDPDHRTKFGTHCFLFPFRQDYVYAEPANGGTKRKRKRRAAPAVHLKE
ncbi:hypothetical protein EDB85DRAFT_1899029 [Lactarius pseudohatsudake]|nr:hypothetical protein EDB85DRAFT_1899029 [Lactarius pseudohatsudake]